MNIKTSNEHPMRINSHFEHYDPKPIYEKVPRGGADM